MTRLNNYILNEGRSVEVSVNDAVNFIRTKAAYFIPKIKKITNYVVDADSKRLIAMSYGSWIYRGQNSLGKTYYIVQPSRSERKSANTLNYYTWIIDNSPDWSQYPKRSRSIICISDRQSSYGGFGYNYMVIPETGSKVGICPAADIWDSFDIKFSYAAGHGSMNEFNSMLSRLFRDIVGKGFDYAKTYQEFLSVCKLVDKRKKDTVTFDTFAKDIYPIDFLRTYWHSELSFYEFLENQLDPNENKFRKVNVEQFDVPNRNIQEVWTDGDSLMINTENVWEVLGELI